MFSVIVVIWAIRPDVVMAWPPRFDWRNMYFSWSASSPLPPPSLSPKGPMPYPDRFQFCLITTISCKSFSTNTVYMITISIGWNTESGHVCTWLCCIISYKLDIVTLWLTYVRYQYLILIDIWLISTPDAFISLLAGVHNVYQVHFPCVPIRVNKQWMNNSLDNFANAGALEIWWQCAV